LRQRELKRPATAGLGFVRFSAARVRLAPAAGFVRARRRSGSSGTSAAPARPPRGSMRDGNSTPFTPL
jgi:hypothetical protein